MLPLVWSGLGRSPAPLPVRRPARVVGPIEQPAEVSQGKLCHSLRRNFEAGSGECPHVLQVAAARSWAPGKSEVNVRRRGVR